MQPGRRQQPQQQQPGQRQAGARQQGGPLPNASGDDAAEAAGAGGGAPGFKTARNQYVSELRKKGQHQQASAYANQVGWCACHRAGPQLG